MEAHQPSESPDALFRDDPGWLADLRRAAWTRREAFSHPTGREEAWRYTDVSRLRDERFSASLERGDTSLEVRRGDFSAMLLDGAPAGIELDPGLAKQGVRLLGLAEAAREHSALVQAHLGRLVGAKDVFTARSLALYRGGLFLHVPAGVTVEAPIRWLQWLGAAGAAVESRALVVLEEGASLHLQDHLRSGDLAEPTRAQPVLEIFLGPNARLTYTGWQTWGAGVHQLQHVHAHLERDARFTGLLGGFGADFARTELHVTLAGEGAAADLLGAYFPTGSQHHEYWTVQDHRAPNTRSDLLFKGALGGAGRALYYGTIRVSPDARRTDAYQANRNLLLSAEARVDTNPQLEIETNDVRCTHGASVGQQDAEQLFYLMSRGIPRAEAERLLVTGFFAEVLHRFRAPGEDTEHRLTEIIHEKLNSI